MSSIKQFKNIPDGITFGSRVIQLPSVQDVFELNCQSVFAQWSWVQRGDPILGFSAEVSKTGNSFFDIFKGKETIKGYYRSPVSGLLIHSTHVSSITSPDERAVNYLMAILLPDDEDAPEDGDYVIGNWLRTCWDYRGEWINGQLKDPSDANVKDIINRQIGYEHRLVDVLPRYENYMKDLRTERPELRPYVKHLQT